MTKILSCARPNISSKTQTNRCVFTHSFDAKLDALLPSPILLKCKWEASDKCPWQLVFHTVQIFGQPAASVKSVQHAAVYCKPITVFLSAELSVCVYHSTFFCTCLLGNIFSFFFFFADLLLCCIWQNVHGQQYKVLTRLHPKNQMSLINRQQSQCYWVKFSVLWRTKAQKIRDLFRVIAFQFINTLRSFHDCNLNVAYFLWTICIAAPAY